MSLNDKVQNCMWVWANPMDQYKLGISWLAAALLSRARLLCCAPDNFGSPFSQSLLFSSHPPWARRGGESRSVYRVSGVTPAVLNQDTSLTYLQATLTLMNVDHISFHI